VHPVLLHLGPIVLPAYGAVSALGVLLGLFLAQRTARIAGVNAAQMWNLCIAALFSALIVQRLLLLVLNWSAVEAHPQWMLALSMIHHPLLAAAGGGAGVAMATLYAVRNHLPPRSTADALAAPLALGLACEQVGALLAGSGYGTETTVRWAVTYTDPLATRWSGAPLGVPLHPVQAYAALGYLALAALLLAWLPRRMRVGDVAGLSLLGAGLVVYLTELFRDPLGRGVLLGGLVDTPQIAAILFVLAGALILTEVRAPKRKDEATHG
jgi:phosphatidylglycerol:prolipoprotein diacylglycerol transferase